MCGREKLKNLGSDRSGDGSDTRVRSHKIRTSEAITWKLGVYPDSTRVRRHMEPLIPYGGA